MQTLRQLFVHAEQPEASREKTPDNGIIELANTDVQFQEYFWGTITTLKLIGRWLTIWIMYNVRETRGMVCYDCGEQHLNITAGLSLLDFGECDISEPETVKDVYTRPRLEDDIGYAIVQLID